MSEEYRKELEEAFPAVDPEILPLGSRILVQIKAIKTRTASGLYLGNDLVDTEKHNTQVAKIISFGPLAFKNRETMTPWPEGDWCKVGDFCRVPKWGGDRFLVLGDDGEEVTFVIYNDLDLVAKLTGNVLQVKAFL